VFFRIGRAIFVVDTLKKEYTEEEAIETPLGLVAKMNDPELEFDKEALDLIQLLHGSTGFLRIICEGDPDCGFAGNYEVLLTGYRGGLDDVIVERKLLQTVHGSNEDIMRNFADELYRRAEWINVPRWETYDGSGYRMTFETELEDEMKRISGAIREMAYKLEHKDDMPDWVREKFKEVEELEG